MTAWAPKALRRLWLVAVVALLVLVGKTLWQQRSLELVYLGKKPILVEVVDTNAARMRGLSGRSSLARGHGMLFKYNQPSASCMWMKEMHFPLDVYWFSATGKLISQAKNVQPGTYPTTYCPNANAFYMLELNAGETVSPLSDLTLLKQ